MQGKTQFYDFVKNYFSGGVKNGNYILHTCQVYNSLKNGGRAMPSSTLNE